MTDKQTEALRLADALDSMTTENIRFDQLDESAAELRRLHEVNAELVEALKYIAHVTKNIGSAHMVARAAIAKATGEQQ